MNKCKCGRTGIKNYEPDKYYISCTYCRVKTYDYNSEEKAIKEWDEMNPLPRKYYYYVTLISDPVIRINTSTINTDFPYFPLQQAKELLAKRFNVQTENVAVLNWVEVTKEFVDEQFEKL